MMENGLLHLTLITFIRYLIYIGIFAGILILLFFLFRIPKNIFRKLLHIAAFTSPVYIALTGEGWLPDTLTLILFAAVIWPALSIAEHLNIYGDLFVEKRPGEVKNSLLLLFLSQAAFTAFCLGVMKRPYILIASCMAWGFGDIAAAWIGRPFGKHKVRLPFADPNKSWEGTAAMFAVAFPSCLICLLLFSGYSLIPAVLISLLTGLVSAFSELISKNGNDTIVVPLADILILSLTALL